MNKRTFILILAFSLLYPLLFFNEFAIAEEPLHADIPPEVAEGVIFQVYVSSGGEPLEGAFVRPEWIEQGFDHYETNAQGIVNLTAPWVEQNTRYSIQVEKEGYGGLIGWIYILDEESPQLVIHVSSPIIEGTDFLVNITADDNPVENAEVTVEWNSWAYFTDENGTTVITAPLVYTTTIYTISVRKAGHLPADDEITVINYVPKLLLTVEPTVFEGENFTVGVTQEDTGGAVEDVEVTFNQEVYHTDSNGRVTITAPEVEDNTEFTLVGVHVGYQTGKATIIVTDTDEEEPSGFIYGMVSCGPIYLSGVTITVTQGDENWITYTDIDGRYSIAVAPGIYEVTASKEGYITETKQGIEVIAYAANEVTFSLEKETEPETTPIQTYDYIDYTIQEKAAMGIIGARMDIFSDENSISYFSSELTIHLNSTKERITFNVSAENNTPGTILVVYIGEGALSDLNNLTVTYDGATINESIYVEEFFNISENSSPSWLRVLTTTGLYMFISVPQFSTHEITISPLQKIIEVSNLTFIIFYLIVIVVAVAVVSIHLKTIWRR